jgi:uncharacterized repeat protein (TIGR02543 family)
MKAVFSLRKHSYLKTIGAFIIAVALIAGVVGCEGEPEPVQYDLAIASSVGGTVTVPGEGTFTYDEGEDVGLVATPDCGYAFDGWTGDTTDIADVNAAATNVTMNADYDINANFKPIPADHYKFYAVDWEEPVYIGEEVELEDQFGKFTATVKEAILFGNPVEKEHGTAVSPIFNDNRHYTVYWLDIGEEAPVLRSVEVKNQFQENVELTVEGPMALAVPTKKEGHEMVECLNHYLLYEVSEADWLEFTPVEGVNLKDQFIPDGEDVTVIRPYLFANPVKKTIVGGTVVSEIEDDDLHWVLYDIYDMEAPSIEKRGLQIDNQFGNDQVLDLTYRDVLAVPSQKNVPPTPPLDHFKCYHILPEPPLEVPDVYVLDQFHEDYLYTWVMEPIMFCNPVDKLHDTVTTSSNPDNHLTVYNLHGETTKGWWTVTVDNQFNDPAVPQTLLVWGPVALAVPTQKVTPGDHGMPKYLDHYLLYLVEEGLNVTATVDLDDQFPGTAPGVEVTQPIYFANPAVKGYVDHVGMWDPEEHLMFYSISDNDEFYGDDVGFRNQFCPEVPCYVDLISIDQLLAVPSVKVEWAPAGPPP